MSAQIITKEDLQIFKQELLDSFRLILKEQSNQGTAIKRWLKSYEVRKMLNISPGIFQNLRVNGSLPYTKVGGSMYYEMEEVKKMMDENKNRNR